MKQKFIPIANKIILFLLIAIISSTTFPFSLFAAEDDQEQNEKEIVVEKLENLEEPVYDMAMEILKSCNINYMQLLTMPIKRHETTEHELTLIEQFTKDKYQAHCVLAYELSKDYDFTFTWPESLDDKYTEYHVFAIKDNNEICELDYRQMTEENHLSQGIYMLFRMVESETDVDQKKDVDVQEKSEKDKSSDLPPNNPGTNAIDAETPSAYEITFTAQISPGEIALVESTSNNDEASAKSVKKNKKKSAVATTTILATTNTETIPEGTKMQITDLSGNEEILSLLKGNYEENFDPCIVDISFIDPEGKEIEPSGNVRVSIKNDIITSLEMPHILHINSNNEIEHMMILSAEDYGQDIPEDMLVFNADSFSVYAVVEGPAQATVEAENADSLSDLTSDKAESGFLMSVTRGQATNYYFRNTLNNNNAFNITTSISAGDKWYFEPDGNGYYYVYTIDDGTYKYITNPSGNFAGLGTKSDAVLFRINESSGGAFVLKKSNENKWLQYSNGGNGIRFWTDTNNTGNARITLTYASTLALPDDVYNYSEATFGLMNYSNGISGEALMAETKKNNALASLSMMVRTNPLEREDTLYVANDSELTAWTFHAVKEDQYKISAFVNGVIKYIKLDSTGLSLVDYADASDIQIVPGTGVNAGKIQLVNDDYAISYEGNNGYKAMPVSTAATQMLNLVDFSYLTDEDFVLCSADKISVSDPSLNNDSKVIVYTRLWNDTNKQYEFYAIDHDGSLVPCFESGNQITWIGTRVNTLLWDFTEYYYEGTTDPNYYYELYNRYSEKYIAPQLNGNQVLSDNTIGINLNGRKYDNYYSSILAWDDPYYTYAGLKIEGDHIVPCPLSEGMDFYFAKMQPTPVAGELTPVQTVEHTQYGITMKLIDFGSSNAMQNAFLGSSAGGINKPPVQGLLSTDLDSNGYPVTAGGNLGLLYNGAEEVNGLFVQSTYDNSGYFEFSSTQNSAVLGDDGYFNVYREMVTSDGTDKATLKHGQFFPFDEIDPNKPAVVNGQNLYDAKVQPLSGSDPRKYEQLYLVEHPNYYFGVEMEASFVMTPSGKDAWGHDIIYEFTGDDDFWLYVDGELVIDLGGIHSALEGTINFCTGQVVVAGKHTSLYELFRGNYATRNGLQETDPAVTAYLNDIFELNENNQYVFKDYTPHTMRIFYMERGAGASNLHMRFNLTYIKEGAFLLGKKISGTDKTDYNHAQFAYQVYYTTESNPQIHLLTQDSSDPAAVYQNTSTPVPFEASYTPTGGNTSYNNVFLLRADEEAEITLPDDTVEYYVVECGVNNSIYDEVYVNDVQISGTVNGNRSDYAISPEAVADRPKVEYTNHVEPNALRALTITKKLYEEDGVTEINYDDDPTLFAFRVSLGGGDQPLKLCNMEPYYIKNEDLEYCVWNPQLQRFDSTGKIRLDQLTEAEKTSATFITSPNGSISKIPAGYSVEMRDLLIGTIFRVDERDYEIPTGYKQMNPGYERVQGSYIVAEGDTLNSGTIRDNSDPTIEVLNQRGWSLTVSKVWSDEAFMLTHDDIYFAVYNRQNGAMIPGTVHVMPSGRSSFEYYFDDLLPGLTFEDYIVREVVLEGSYTSDSDGFVTGYTSAVPVEPDDTMNVWGTTNDNVREEFTYSATYDQGEPGGTNNNIRQATATNTRKGLMIVKTDLTGSPLEGAVFTLTDSNEEFVGASSYSSDSTGLVTIAYIDDGTYTLAETKSPHGYKALNDRIIITMENGQVSVSGADPDGFTLDNTGSMPVLTIRNKPFQLQILKKDPLLDTYLEGVHFALHKEVEGIDGPIKDYRPMPAYADLVTDSNGILSGDFAALLPGTYYLAETKPLPGYSPLTSDICFTISDTGVVTVTDNNSMIFDTSDNGINTYQITVLNGAKINDLSVRKTVRGNMGNRYKTFDFTLALSGSSVPTAVTYEKSDGTSGSLPVVDGQLSFVLAHNEEIIFKNITVGLVYTVTEANYGPEGYVLINEANNMSGVVTTGDTIEITVINEKTVAIPTDIFDGKQPLWLFIITVTIFISIVSYLIKDKKRN